MNDPRRRGTTPSIRYALASIVADDGQVGIVLDLYRGSRPVFTRRIALVEPKQVKWVMARCQDRLEARGVEAIGGRAVVDPPLSAQRRRPVVAVRSPAAEPIALAG